MKDKNSQGTLEEEKMCWDMIDYDEASKWCWGKDRQTGEVHQKLTSKSEASVMCLILGTWEAEIRKIMV
jgi:hypothetical protein